MVTPSGRVGGGYVVVGAAEKKAQNQENNFISIKEIYM
jgi:hypothetical protein